MSLTTRRLTSEREAKSLPVVYVITCIILIAPIWLVSDLPLQDYPAHMARMHILSTLDENPILQEIYRIDWQPIPNLAMDLILPSLALAMPLAVAGKVLLSTIVATWTIGPLAVHHALFGRPSYWPLVASFFTYNQCLLYGFVNFSFGAGLSFLVLAVWIRSRSGSIAPRIVLSSALATILFFCHFIAFAIYGLAVVGYEAAEALQDGGSRRLRLLAERLCIALAQFVIPVSIFLLLSPTKNDLIPTAEIDWGGIEGRLAAVRSVIWFDNGVFDYLAFAFTASVFLYALVTNSLEFSRPFLGSLALLSVAALLTPSGLDGPGLRHIRIPPVLAALFFAGSRFKGEMPDRIKPAVIALGLAIFLARTASTAVRWQALDEQIAEFREALSDIREGASLLMVTVGPADHAFRRAGGGSLLHVADYATIDRSAFVPTVFADPGVQPIHLADHYWENYRRVPHRQGAVGPSAGDGARGCRRSLHPGRLAEEVRLRRRSERLQFGARLHGLPGSHPLRLVLHDIRGRGIDRSGSLPPLIARPRRIDAHPAGPRPCRRLPFAPRSDKAEEPRTSRHARRRDGETDERNRSRGPRGGRDRRRPGHRPRRGRALPRQRRRGLALGPRRRPRRAGRRGARRRRARLRRRPDRRRSRRRGRRGGRRPVGQARHPRRQRRHRRIERRRSGSTTSPNGTGSSTSTSTASSTAAARWCRTCSPPATAGSSPSPRSPARRATRTPPPTRPRRPA